MIEEDTFLYEAIEEAIMKIFDEIIPLDSPYDTAKLFVESINDKIFSNSGYEEDIEVSRDHINTKNILTRIIK